MAKNTFVAEVTFNDEKTYLFYKSLLFTAALS